MSTGRNPEPSLDREWFEDWQPYPRRPAPDADELAELIFGTGTALSSFGADLAEAEREARRGVARNVDAPLETIGRPELD